MVSQRFAKASKVNSLKNSLLRAAFNLRQCAERLEATQLAKKGPEAPETGRGLFSEKKPRKTILKESEIFRSPATGNIYDKRGAGRFEGDEDFLKMTIGLTPAQREQVAKEVDALLTKHDSQAVRFYNDLLAERCMIALRSTQGRSLNIRGVHWSEQ